MPRNTEMNAGWGTAAASGRAQENAEREARAGIDRADGQQRGGVYGGGTGRKAKVEGKVRKPGETLCKRQGDYGKKRKRGLAAERGSWSPPQRGREGWGERGRENERPEKESQTLTLLVWCVGKDLHLKDTEKSRWRVENGGAATPAGRALAQPQRAGWRCPLPDAPARRPAAPERAPALPGPARAGRWHEIGCSGNESALRGGG